MGDHDLYFANTTIYGFHVDEFRVVSPTGGKTWLGVSVREPLQRAVAEQGESGTFELEGLTVTYRGARPIADA